MNAEPADPDRRADGSPEETWSASTDPGSLLRSLRDASDDLPVQTGPMVMKYFGVSELVRQAASALVARRLGIAAGILLAAGVASAALDLFIGGASKSGSWRTILCALPLIYGATAAAVVLGWLTRRQIEGLPCPARELIRHARRHAAAILVLPPAALLPAALAVSLLWLAGAIRGMNEGTRLGYEIGYPLLFVLAAAAAAGGGLSLLALAYLPAIMAAEELDLLSAMQEVLGHAARNGLRMLYHAVTILALTAVVSLFSALLCWGAAWLPDALAGVSAGTAAPALRRSYQVLPLCLAIVVPLSALSVCGFLSYLVLKQEDEVFETGPPGETAAGSDAEGPES